MSLWCLTIFISLKRKTTKELRLFFL
jgi:hypothetical protein